MSKDKETENKLTAADFGLADDWLRDDLRQGDLEDFADAYQVYEEAGKTKGAIRYHGALLRAAIDAGWLNTDIAADDVGEMHGGQVRYMARAIDQAYIGATTIPKN